MYRLLPFTFLLAFFSLFGLAWIVFEVDPDAAQWHIFILFIGLLFLFIFNIIGTFLYFVRTWLNRKYDPKWYFRTSFKMAFFVAVFVSMTAGLSILNLLTKFNLFLGIIAVSLISVWSYLGKKRG